MKFLLVALILLACNGKESGEARYSAIKQDVIPTDVQYSVQTRVYTAKADSTDVQLEWESIVETLDTTAVKASEWARAEEVKDSIDAEL